MSHASSTTSVLRRGVAGGKGFTFATSITTTTIQPPSSLRVAGTEPHAITVSWSPPVAVAGQVRLLLWLVQRSAVHIIVAHSAQASCQKRTCLCTYVDVCMYKICAAAAHRK